MSDMKLLWEIQMLDIHRRALEERLKDQTVPQELKILKNSIETAQDDLRETRVEYGRLKREVRLFDEEDIRMRDQIADIEQQLRSVSFDAAQIKEIHGERLERVESLKENLVRLEGRQQSLVEVMERIHRRIEDQALCLARHRERYRRLQGTYQMNVENIRRTLAQIPMARQRLIDAVDAGLWKRYVQLRTRFKDPVGKVARGICYGCRMEVPFTDLKRLKMDSQVVFCANCGRMLFWERVERKS